MAEVTREQVFLSFIYGCVDGALRALVATHPYARQNFANQQRALADYSSRALAFGLAELAYIGACSRMALEHLGWAKRGWPEEADDG